MSSSDPRIEPADIVGMVDLYIEGELDTVAKYSNRELFDESGCFSLHRLAAAIYARGHDDGERAERARTQGQRHRDRARTANADPS